MSGSGRGDHGAAVREHWRRDHMQREGRDAHGTAATETRGGDSVLIDSDGSDDELEAVRAARRRYLQLLGEESTIPDVVNLGLDVSVEDVLAEDEQQEQQDEDDEDEEQERGGGGLAGMRRRQTTWTEAVVLGASLDLDDEDDAAVMAQRDDDDDDDEEDEEERRRRNEEARRRRRRQRERQQLLSEAANGPSRALRFGLTGTQSRMRDLEGTQGRQIRHQARTILGDMDSTEHTTAAGVFRGGYRSRFVKNGGGRSEQEEKAEEDRVRGLFDDLRIERTSERMFSLTGKYFGGVTAITGGPQAPVPPQQSPTRGERKARKKARKRTSTVTSAISARGQAPLSERLERHVDEYVYRAHELQQHRQQQQQQQQQEEDGKDANGVFITGLDLDAARAAAQEEAAEAARQRDEQLWDAGQMKLDDIEHCTTLAPTLSALILPSVLIKRPLRLPPHVNTPAVLERAATAVNGGAFRSAAHEQAWDDFYWSERSQILFLDATWCTLATHFDGGSEVWDALMDRMAVTFVPLCMSVEPAYKDDVLFEYASVLMRAVFLALRTMFREESDAEVLDLAFLRRLSVDVAQWLLGYVPGDFDQSVRAWFATVNKKVDDDVSPLFLPPAPDHEEQLSERLDQAARTGGPTDQQREKWKQQQQNVGSTELVQQTARSVAQNLIRSGRKQRPSFEPPPEPDESQEPYNAVLVPIRAHRELATVGHSVLVSRFLERRGVSTTDLAVQLPISRPEHTPGLRATMKALYNVKSEADEARAHNTKLLQNYNKVNKKYTKLARKEAEHYQEQRRKLEKQRQMALKDPHTFAASILLESKTHL